MGIDTSVAQLLLGAKASGADYTDSLMIGRQFFYPDPDALAQMFRWHGIDCDAGGLVRQSAGWAEAFFTVLGADRVASMDASSFEGATHIHDMNVPIDDSLKERFSVVFDGGTLEHVFNFPQALRNCMEMLTVGGTFIQHTPANNFMGHGFYQFSPELFYRVFGESNGFEVVAVLLQESVRGGRWYAVADPADLGKRVQLTNRLPTIMCTIARRVARVPVLQSTPQQTDYAAGWKKTDVASGGVYRRRPDWRRGLAGMAHRYLPERVERLLRTAYSPGLDGQPDCFRRVEVRDLVQGHIPQMR
jgi:hypothetical protein